MDTSGELNPGRDNPYVGPRPYTRKEENLFFGRERESRDLLSLVVSERLVLFYAQSGAGKTSLINTRLVPGLEGRNFEVLPVGRVSGELLPGQHVENIYAANLMLKLDMGEDDPTRFTGLRLAEFLLSLSFDGKGFYYRAPTQPSPVEASPAAAGPDEAEIQVLPRALIIDQFEELFTTHPEAWKLREDFIRQLADAMQADPYLWVVLAMREDHIAELDPYISLLPDGLRARYYMQRMRDDAALEAVTRPVEKLRPFDKQAAQLLAKNLSRISAGKDAEGKTRFVDGEFIEPVQLQVVCYQLWEDLKGQPGDHITLDDLQRLARGQDLAEFINRALADFYQDTIKKALRQPGIRAREGKLREWFSTELITEASTRGFVYMGEHLTAGIPNAVVLYLEGKLLRSESRAGGRWYELVHDRFIDPILQANRQWTQIRQRKLLTWAGGGILGILLVSLCLFVSSSAYSTYTVAAVNSNSNASATALEGTGTAVATALEGTSAANATTVKEVDRTSTANAGTMVVLDLTSTADSAAQSTLEVARTAAAAEGKANSMALQQTVQGTDASVDATRSSLVAQQRTLQPTIGTDTSVPQDAPTASLPPTTSSPGGPQDTPAPTSEESTPTPTPPEIVIIPPDNTYSSTATAIQKQLDVLNAAQTAQTQPVRYQVIGYTSNKTPIQVTKMGSGPRNIVLVGGLTGSFGQSSRELSKTVQDFFKTNPQNIPRGVTLHILSDANPDSAYAPGTIIGRLNPNGVDLNRNWDCNWAKDAVFSTYPVDGGSAPFSEPETQALRDYFLLTKPEAVIILDATYLDNGIITPGGCGNQSLFSDWLVSVYAKSTGYILGEVATKDTGDATNWLDTQGIPAIRVRLPYIESDKLKRDELKKQEDNNIRAVRAVIDQIAK